MLLELKNIFGGWKLVEAYGIWRRLADMDTHTRVARMVSPTNRHRFVGDYGRVAPPLTLTVEILDLLDWIG